MPILDAKQVVNAVISAERTSLALAAANTVKFSLGKYTYKKLERHNYPYGLGKENAFGPRGQGLKGDVRGFGQGEGVPYGDSAIINRQSGLFAASWQVTEPRLVGDELVCSIENTAPYADDLALGIDGLTIPRPLLDAVAEKVEAVRENNLIHELSQ